jgi:phage terminase large subunit-like protein
MVTPSVDAYKHWSPASQEKALKALQERTARNWRPFYCPNPTCDGYPHDDWEWNHARADQRPPTDSEWLVWLLQSGRGTGKTRTGTEYTHRVTRKMPRIAIIAGTATDAREVMLEGESGIMTIAPPDHRPTYEPSKRRLTWPNGAIGTIFSAEEPDRLRGPEHYYAWLDEPAHWPLIQECWDNLLFGLRLGARPRILCSTTPKVRPWLKELRADPRTRTVTVSTYENLQNLSPLFAERVIDRYENTRLGRQELYGELLEDVEGALWTWDMIEPHRVAMPPVLARIIIGIDPAGSTRAGADETGIIVAGSDYDGDLYPLEDATGHYTPHGWATKVKDLYEKWSADAVVAEKNYGGDMVEHTLRMAGVDARLVIAQARRGKQLRAEPLVGMYEQGKVHHVGILTELEAQMTEWVPYDKRQESPDRVDALVYATALLMKRRDKAVLQSPATFQLRPATL